jgi:hypothetical protein
LSTLNVFGIRAAMINKVATKPIKIYTKIITVDLENQGSKMKQFEQTVYHW